MRDRTRRVGGSLVTGRRDALRLIAAGAGALAAPFIIRAADAQGRRIVVRDSGGPFTKGFAEAFYRPFTQATGIEVVGVASNAEPTSEIKSMVETKTYTWDLAGISLAAIEQLVQGGYIEKHGLDDDAAVKQVLPEYRSPYGVGSDVYSTVLAYRTDKVKPEASPKSWADFWNVKEFPGRRGLRKYPFDTIEQALFADGVASDKVYPCDFDRAFRALDRIKPHIAAWWSGGAQATQMLVSGEVDIMPTWIARVVAAAQEGAPLGVMWDQNMWGVDAWAILKGTPNADRCRQFIRFTCDAQRQAAYTPYVANGPTNPGAYDFIEEKRARMLPTHPDNRAKGVAIDNTYWSKNKDEALERFNTWVLG
jgi:putative spermidine/putrescine transport system substrate-binding protein